MQDNVTVQDIYQINFIIGLQ